MASKDLLLEIGCEELPAAFIDPAIDALCKWMETALSELRLKHEEIQGMGTPRRLAVLVRAVSERQPDERKLVTGPPERAAFDADGAPTRAALGFAAGQSIPVETLKVIDTPKGRYVSATVESSGQAAVEVLPQHLAQGIANLPFRKSMRWGSEEVHFARPVHWIVALLGSQVLPFEFGEVKSDRKTRGHRFLAPGVISLRSPKGYVEKLRAAKVLVDPAEREAAVAAALAKAVAADHSGWQLREDSALLREVTHLVEWPVAVLGSYDPKHLDLPREVLISEMREHQRYFAVEERGTGTLVPSFVAVSNTEVKDPAVIRNGYQRVLSARLADARHFFDTDRRTPLAERVVALDRVVFQKQLGSMHAKAERIRALALWLAGQLGFEKYQPQVDRAAVLCKADLVTGMVGEFPELQGVMGRHYAALDGEGDTVALAIEEHYLPRHAGDRLPTQDVGALIGLADRLDSLVGIFGIGKPPTGTADPFGLRRACLGVVAVVLDRGYRLDLSQALAQGCALYGDLLPPKEGLGESLMEFFRGRLRHLWKSRYPLDVIDAVLSAGFAELRSAHQRVEALATLKSEPDFESLAVAFTRASKLVAKAPAIDAQEVDRSLFEDESEDLLWKQMMRVRERVAKAYALHDYRVAFEAMSELKQPVDHFFEQVLVMAEDVRVRDNRLLLLREISMLFDQVADFSQIQSE